MSKLPEPTWEPEAPTIPEAPAPPVVPITEVPKPPVAKHQDRKAQLITEEETSEEAPQESYGQHEPLRQIEAAYHRSMEALGSTGGAPVLTPEDEKLVVHALAILPHVGADATATYLTSASAS